MMNSKFAALAGLILAAGGAWAQKLDTTTFVVMGEGLAAGMANYGLSSVVQEKSFPAQVAAQMGTAFMQPLIEPPGIGDVVGYPGQEVRLQAYPSGAVRKFYKPEITNPHGDVRTVYTPDNNAADAPPLFVQNVSIPALTLNDSLYLRPYLPIAQRNMKQTVINMIIGFPQLFFTNAIGGTVAQWTQFEYAKALNPTIALVELGFYEALDGAVTGDVNRIPDATSFGATYSTILAGLRGLQAQVIATTIPNPIDTGYFNSPTAAAAITSTLPFVISAGYGLSSQDFVTRNGLQVISNQFSLKTLGKLPPGSTMTAATAAAITAKVNALNAAIVAAAKANGAVVYDMNAFFRKIKVSGATAGKITVNGDYLGGFYSLDGVYPGATGHALIANDLLAFINSTYRTAFPLVNLANVVANDTIATITKPKDVVYTLETLGISAGASADVQE